MISEFMDVDSFLLRDPMVSGESFRGLALKGVANREKVETHLRNTLHRLRNYQ